jgi:hypothetical protein
VGVFPESEIRLPKINPTDRDWNELANGRTHLFMQCNERRQYGWGDESELKMAIAKQYIFSDKLSLELQLGLTF